MNNNSHDPLTVLHGDDLPVQPDPAFAATLRARLESVLSLPNRTQGVVMSGTDTAIAELNEPIVEPEVASAPPRPAALPYLSVANAREQQTHPMAGVAGGAATATTVPMWTVDDVEAAVARVREAGGTVIQEPSQQPYGKTAQCTDDQGGRFYLGEF